MKISKDRKYRTREGSDVELLSTCGRSEYPVVGYIDCQTVPDCWDWDGRNYCASECDLVEVREPREWTIQVDADGKVYPHSMLVTGVHQINGPIETVHVREVLEGEQ